jgi:hypothetical protein
MTYKRKENWRLSLLPLAGIAWTMVRAIREHHYVLLAGPPVIALLVVIFAWPQNYTTTGDALYIRAGMRKRVIPWSEIISMLSDPDVFSPDRILIATTSRSRRVVLAPDDPVRFFDDVAAHCPQLSRRGMDLVIALN